MRYLAKRQFRHGSRIIPAGDVVELTASAARYLRLRGWIEPVRVEPAPPPETPAAPAPPAAPSRRTRRSAR